jgi:hypothetical protein
VVQEHWPAVRERAEEQGGLFCAISPFRRRRRNRRPRQRSPFGGEPLELARVSSLGDASADEARRARRDSTPSPRGNGVADGRRIQSSFNRCAGVARSCAPRAPRSGTPKPPLRSFSIIKLNLQQRFGGRSGRGRGAPGTKPRAVLELGLRDHSPCPRRGGCRVKRSVPSLPTTRRR